MWRMSIPYNKTVLATSTLPVWKTGLPVVVIKMENSDNVIFVVCNTCWKTSILQYFVEGYFCIRTWLSDQTDPKSSCTSMVRASNWHYGGCKFKVGICSHTRCNTLFHLGNMYEFTSQLRWIFNKDENRHL